MGVLLSLYIYIYIYLYIYTYIYICMYVCTYIQEQIHFPFASYTKKSMKIVDRQSNINHILLLKFTRTFVVMAIGNLSKIA